MRRAAAWRLVRRAGYVCQDRKGKLILLAAWNWRTLRKVSLELVNLRAPGEIVWPCISFPEPPPPPPGCGSTADLKAVGGCERTTLIFPRHAAKYAVPGLRARVQSEVPHCLFDQLERASAGQDSDVLPGAARQIQLQPKHTAQASPQTHHNTCSNPHLSAALCSHMQLP